MIDMFGDADRIGTGEFGHRDIAVAGGLEVGMVQPDLSGNRELQPGRLGDALGGELGGPERLRDDDVGIQKLAFDFAVGSDLVRRHD